MNGRQVLVMLGGAAIVYACAPRNHTTPERTARTTTPSNPTPADTSAFALTVAAARDPRTIEFAIEFRNTKKSLAEVRFANGRTHDFVVLDDTDREVWRWSTGRLFTQTMQTKQLKTGDAMKFAAKWDSAAPGHYRVIASLNSATHADPIEREFVVH